MLKETFKLVVLTDNSVLLERKQASTWGFPVIKAQNAIASCEDIIEYYSNKEYSMTLKDVCCIISNEKRIDNTVYSCKYFTAGLKENTENPKLILIPLDELESSKEMKYDETGLVAIVLTAANKSPIIEKEALKGALC